MLTSQINSLLFLTGRDPQVIDCGYVLDGVYESSYDFYGHRAEYFQPTEIVLLAGGGKPREVSVEVYLQRTLLPA